MSPPTEHGKLCSLADKRLRPLLDKAAQVSSAEATEKGILIALSQVFRQVKQWTTEFDSHKDLLEEFANQREHSVAACLCSAHRHCLSMIIDYLVCLLACDSRYIQHLAGNTLVATAEFLDASEKGLEDFIDLLCIFLEQEISVCLSSSQEFITLKTRVSDIDPIISRSCSNLKNGNWFVVASIFRVLRNILKYLKQEYDDKVLTPYLDSVSSFISRLPWDVISKIFADPDVDAIKRHAEVVSLHTKVVQRRELNLFSANMIQCLCSLMELSNYAEDGFHSRPLIHEIINLVPKIILWCHAKPGSHVRISHYFKHKVLMLMIKLSDSISIGSNILMSWIHLLHQYFEDLLLQPLSGNGNFDKDDCLEGSPFCTSVSDPGMSIISSRHLQRLTVFIFLKCSINMATMKGNSDDQQSVLVDLNLGSQCGYVNKGLTELNKWLEFHVTADLTNDDFYLQGCLRFTSSFLDLFMHEDDMLFDALLQLLRLPFHAEHRTSEFTPVAEAENYHNFLASDLFNPVHLFRLFLAELLYDHQVLLDYLISKDTGSSCAEYLLRSLRIVCEFWELFVKFPGAQEFLGEFRSKMRKHVLECSDFKALPSPALVNDGMTLSHGKDCDEVHAKRIKFSRNHRQPFLAANDCLISLKTSVKSLHQKNLFPYNPKALLHRLARFEELSSSYIY